MTFLITAIYKRVIRLFAEDLLLIPLELPTPDGLLQVLHELNDFIVSIVAIDVDCTYAFGHYLRLLHLIVIHVYFVFVIVTAPF